MLCKSPLRWALIVLLCFLGACSPTVSKDQSTRQAVRGMISASFSYDGKFEFVGSINHGGSLWRTQDNERLYSWNHSSEAFSVIRNAAFSEDGKYLATTMGKDIALWSTESGESIRYWRSPSRILSMDLAQQYILLGQDNHEAVIFDTVRGGIIGSLEHSAPVRAVAIDSLAKLALTGADDGSAKLWSLTDGKTLYHWPHNTPLDFVQISPDGRIALTAAYQGAVSLWDTNTGELLHQLYRKNPNIVAATFKEHRLLLGTSREKIILWNLDKMEVQKSWHIPNDGTWQKAAVLALAFTQNGYIVAASNGLTYTLNK